MQAAAGSESSYWLDASGASQSSPSTVSAVLTNGDNDVKFNMEIVAIDGGSFRLRVS